MQTQTFKYDPNRFEEVKKALLKKWTPILIGAFGIGLYIALSNENNSTDILLSTAPFVIIFASIVVSIRSFSIVKRQKALYESYRLMIDEHAIAREQVDTPATRILKSDISKIDINKNGGFTIIGRNYGDKIYVAGQIENYDELKNMLQQIKPFNN